MLESEDLRLTSTTYWIGKKCGSVPSEQGGKKPQQNRKTVESLREQRLDKLFFHFDLELEMGLKEVPALLRLACKHQSTSERRLGIPAFS